MGRRWGTRLLAAAVALSLLVTGCGDAGDGDGGTTARGTGSGTPVQGGTLVDLQNFAQGEPDHIDPALAQTVQASQPGHLLFDGLTESDFRSGEARPMVAESFTGNDDATVWTFRIRRGVTFSDGAPVLPSDFKFAWERAVQPELGSPVSYHFDPIKGKADVDGGRSRTLSGVVADDAAMTLTVELAFPYSAFPLTVSHLVFSPVPRRLLEGRPDQAAWDQGVMVGNGPFRMKEPWRHGRSITLARNDRYWGGLNRHLAYLDEVEFRISQDVDSAFAAFESDQGHTALIPPGRFREAGARYRGRTVTSPTLGTYFWVFNMRDPAVGGPGNKRLREAIALAIDRAAIVDTVYNGSRRVATGFAPPGVPGYGRGLDEEHGRDVAEARRRLGEHGKPPPRLRLDFNAGAGHDPVALVIQANLADIGIASDLGPRDPTTYVASLQAGTGQLSSSGWVADYVSYDNFLYPLFHSRGGDNLAGYANPEVDGLIERARRTAGDDERSAIYRQAERAVLEDQVVVPLNWYSSGLVYHRSVRNLVQSPLRLVAYDEIYLER